MQAEVGGERRRRRIIILIAVLLAVVAAVGTYSLSTRPGGGAVATPVPRTIVVAATDIKARTRITTEMLTTAAVPDHPAFRTAISDPAVAVGNVAIVDIVTGEPIRLSMFGTGNPIGVTILAPGETVAPDSPVWRAVSVKIPAERAVAALVNVGDHVDLIGTVDFELVGATASPVPGDPQSGKSTKITLLDIEILNADPDTSLYVLKVDENQAEEIAHVQAEEGTFTFALRPQADARDLDRGVYGETLDRIVTQYGFPIPEVLILPLVTPPAGSPAPGPTAQPTP